MKTWEQLIQCAPGLDIILMAILSMPSCVLQRDQGFPHGRQYCVLYIGGEWDCPGSHLVLDWKSGAVPTVHTYPFWRAYGWLRKNEMFLSLVYIPFQIATKFLGC